MERFYRVAITKVPIGTAVEYREPAIKGKVIVKVSDMTTSGSFKLFVVKCDDAQNEANLAFSGVSELSEDNALKLAAQYQPQRQVTRFNSKSRKEETTDIPVCDLRKYYHKI